MEGAKLSQSYGLICLAVAALTVARYLPFIGIMTYRLMSGATLVIFLLLNLAAFVMGLVKYKEQTKLSRIGLLFGGLEIAFVIAAWIGFAIAFGQL